MAVIHPNEEPHSPSPWEREWGSRNRDGDKDCALIFSTEKQDGLTCIYEIMSITTPQAPYGDNFQSWFIWIVKSDMLSICQPFWYSGVGMAVIHPNEEPHSPSPWEREWGSRNRDGDKDYALIFSTGTPFL
nr:hypothetical protein Iba_chr12eCG9600 [Ipomoea batatas]